jgi:hypothetical protein
LHRHAVVAEAVWWGGICAFLYKGKKRCRFCAFLNKGSSKTPLFFLKSMSKKILSSFPFGFFIAFLAVSLHEEPQKHH